ncbi:MAG: DUF1592 domain-containing protein, partial [Verrucomicrobiaceae bacterium]
MFARPILSALLLPAVALAAGPEDNYKKEILPLLEDYCFSCHADGTAKGKFSMDEYKDLASHLNDRKHWLPVWRNVRSQIMPPSDKDQFSPAEKRKLQEWIEKEVFKLDLQNPDPGRVTIRRLNRTEYQNAVFDLLGVEYDTKDVFPPDDTGYGFDNIALKALPSISIRGTCAADEVVALALPAGAAAQVPRIDIEGKAFKVAFDTKTTGRWLPFSKKETVTVDQEIPYDGEYQVKVEYAIKGATEATVHEANLVVKAGAAKVGEVSLGWDQRRVIDLTGKAPLKKGKQTFEISLNPGRQPAAGEEELFFTLHRVIVQGPLGGDKREYAKGYRMIFVDGPAPEEPTARAKYARKIMRSFVSRAFRKPLDDSTIDRLVGIVNEVDRQPGKEFEDGIKQAIATCLASPRFLFRVEIQPEPNNASKIVPLDEYSIAARLSFFLWGSVPDDELLSLAFNTKLRANLHAQIDRMLLDPRSSRLTENFIGQWLQARDVESVPVSAKDILGLGSNRDAARAFDVRLRSDMQTETKMLFDFVLRKDRPSEEL